jgi:hypothetical protein
MTPAPREVVRSPAQNTMAEILHRQSPQGLTPEQADERQQSIVLRDALRAHDPTALPRIRAEIQSGRMTEGQGVNLVHTAAVPAIAGNFKRLSLADALAVYNQGTPAEKSLWRPILEQKAENAVKQHKALPLGLRAVH